MLIEKDLTEKVLNAAFKIHSALGPGLLESAYEECLFYELSKEDILIEKQKCLPLVYEDVRLDAGYRIDLMVDNKVIVEIKAVEAINDVHLAQILTYMKLSKKRVGLLINFNVKHLKDGIKRLVL